ncbi:MAG: hypothetical protein GWP06_19400, partial [Actinobacteria bacterium]|nr:hypothetical protein [Actinomycetota bacterium]
KDLYARATYKIGGLGEAGGTAGQASATSAFYIDNSIRLGGFIYSGKATKASLEDKFSVLGVDLDWWLNRLNIVGTLLTMQSNYIGIERKSLAYFAEANYVLYPWLIAYTRYEFTDVNKDDNVDARTSIIPAMIIMLRANVKCSLEYNLPLDTASKGGGGLTYQFNIAF